MMSNVCQTMEDARVLIGAAVLIVKLKFTELVD